MGERCFVSECPENCSESVLSEHEADTKPAGMVPMGNLYGGNTGITEAFGAVNRPLMSQQLVESLLPTVKVMEILGQQFTTAMFPTVKVMEALGQQFTTAMLPTVKVMEVLGQQFTTAMFPTVKVMEVLGQQFTTAMFPTVKVMEALGQQLINVNTLKVPQTQPEVGVWSKSPIGECITLESTPILYENRQWLDQFDELVSHRDLQSVCRKLFADGHYAVAVEKAFIYVNNMVSKKSGHVGKDGADLMRAVFSPKSSVLRLNRLESQSDRNEQQGYMHIFEGVMIGIRNPRAHEHDLEDSPEEALELLSLANHLMRVLTRSILA